MTDAPRPKPEPQPPSTGGFVSLKALKGAPPQDPVAEIRRIYYNTTPKTIEHDVAEAIELLKRLPTEEARERAAVYMDGLAEMRSDWARRARVKGARQGTSQKGRGRRR